MPSTDQITGRVFESSKNCHDLLQGMADFPLRTSDSPDLDSACLKTSRATLVLAKLLLIGSCLPHFKEGTIAYNVQQSKLKFVFPTETDG